jgi:putative acetyltransferase
LRRTFLPDQLGPDQLRPYSFRLADDGDAEALSQICRLAIAEIGPHKYSAAQIAAWLARAPAPARFRERLAQHHQIFVAADGEDHPVAYALLEPDGHLDHLYCHPQHSRRGLAARLLAIAEGHARSQNIKLLYTEASELAKAAFERAGYTVTKRRDFAIEGVAIHNYAMEKPLI